MRICWFFESQLWIVWIVIVYWRLKLVFKFCNLIVILLKFIYFWYYFIFCKLSASFLTWTPWTLLFLCTFCCWKHWYLQLALISKWAAETCFCWKVSFNPFKATIFVNFVLLLAQMGSSINAATVLKCKIKNKCCFLTYTFTILRKMFHNMYLV